MNIFGIGPAEIGIIMVVILVFFGPSKMPEVAGQVGKWVRDFRKMSADLTGEFEKSLNEAGAGDLRRTLDTELRGMRSQVESVGRSVERDLGGKKTGTASTRAGSRSGTTTTRAAGKALSGGKASGTATTTAGKTATAANGTAAAPGGKTSTVKPMVKAMPKATKADPLADLIELDFVAPATVRPARSLARGTAAEDTVFEIAEDRLAPSAPAVDAAVERARARRSTAQYNRARA